MQQDNSLTRQLFGKNAPLAPDNEMRTVFLTFT